MSKQTQVVLFAVISAVIQALIPVLDSDVLTVYDLVMPVLTVVTGVLSRNCKGQIFTIAGIVSAGLASFHLAHPTPEGLTLRYVLSAYAFPLILQIVGALSHSGGGYKEEA